MNTGLQQVAPRSRFTGRTVLISGAARGMGAGHARGFAAEGALVVVADVLDEEGEQLARELGEQAVFVHLDVTEASDWESAVTAAEAAFGPVGVLVNNAGITHFGLIEETEPDAWRRMIDVNLTGQFLGIRIARMHNAHENAALIHLPVHASWLNQAELFFSIVQRKALTPNDLAALPELARRLMDFGQHYRNIAQPFEWTFTRHKLDRVLDKITAQPEQLPLAA